MQDETHKHGADGDERDGLAGGLMRHVQDGALVRREDVEARLVHRLRVDCRDGSLARRVLWHGQRHTGVVLPGDVHNISRNPVDRAVEAMVVRWGEPIECHV